MKRKTTSIDIITSAFNEEQCLPEFFIQINNVIKREKLYKFRLIVIDNGSFDSTWSIITAHAMSNKKIVGLKMSRNFVFDNALSCGLDHAESDAAIIMASDLQDPPEVIHQFLRAYESGYNQVVAKVIKRETVPLVRRILTSIFYKMAHKLTNRMIPEFVSDFRLLDKETYTAIRSMRERFRFLRGMSSWVGFKTFTIEIIRPPRFGGKSKWLGSSLLFVISRAIKNLLSFSSLPLSWVSRFSLLVLFSFPFFLILLISLYLKGSADFLNSSILITFGLISYTTVMLSIGIIAQYVGLIYEEVKQRPIYIIAEQINL